MTPTTTPAPMTHEGDDVFIPKPFCIRADGACFEEGECLSDCEALDLSLMRGASERELRQRLERAERDRNDWRTRADALAAEVESLRSRVEAAENDASFWESRCWVARQAGVVAELARLDGAKRIAELEAGIGRCEANLEWLQTTGVPWLRSWAKKRADELRSLLRITHEEGRG